MTTQVLLLNVTYEPLASIDYRDAIDLMLRRHEEKDKSGKPVEVPVAVPVDESGVARRVRTPSTWFEVPHVLKLTRYYHVPHIKKRWSRGEVKKRDSYTCIYCGVSANDRGMSRRDFTIDHIIPESRGGKSTFANTACSCYDCNHTKGSRTPQQMGWKLRWEPKIPRTGMLVISGDYPKPWKEYLPIK